MKNRVIALLAACAMVTTAGCGTANTAPSGALSGDGSSQSQSSTPDESPAEPTEVDRDTIYTVSVDNNVNVSFDADGKVVQEQEQEEGKRTLNDPLTGEPSYQIHTKTEDTGEDNEWGGPTIRSTTALYDMDGKLLYDYGDYTYDEGLGGLLVRKDHRGLWVSIDDIPADFFSELWDPATGESVQPKVAAVSLLDKDKQLFAALDIWGNLLGTLDSSGKLVKQAQNAYQANIVGNRLVVSNTAWDDYETTDRGYTLMDEELNPIVTVENINTYLSWERYGLFSYSDKDEMGVMDGDGNKVLTLEQSKWRGIEFFDGELLVVSDGFGNSALMKLDGTQLGKAYEQIEPICPDKYNITAPVTQFVARQGSSASILDSQGNVVRSSDVAQLDLIGDANGKWIIYYTTDNMCGLLDMQLEVALAADKYRSLYQPRSYGSDDSITTYALVVAQRYPSASADGNIDYSHTRLDIYDNNLDLIADSLTEVGTVGKGRIAVVRGFSAGLIDWQGNWIGKTSIFQTAGDERKVEIY